MRLSDVPIGESVRIIGTEAPLRERRRQLELGLRPGAVVSILRQAPLGGPIAVRVGGGVIALRVVNAAGIEVRALLDG